jgi:hypothetical protein
VPLSMGLEGMDGSDGVDGMEGNNTLPLSDRWAVRGWLVGEVQTKWNGPGKTGDFHMPTGSQGRSSPTGHSNLRL